MTGDGVHRHEGYNYCNHCHSTHFGGQFYGVPPGAETIEEQALREAREKAERERKIKEIEEARARGPPADTFEFPPIIKVMEAVTIMPVF